MRAAAFLCLLLFSTLVAASPAEAKGAQSLTITGPGLDEPIEVDLAGGDTPSYLVIALMDLTNPNTISSELDLSPEPPGVPLEDKYTLTWHMAHPPDADLAGFTKVQDVYLDRFWDPVLYVHPSEYGGTEGGWTVSPSALRDTLAALGVPIEGMPELATARSQPPSPDRSSDPAAWPVPLAAATGLVAGLGVGITFTKRRLTAAG